MSALFVRFHDFLEHFFQSKGLEEQMAGNFAGILMGALTLLLAWAAHKAAHFVLLRGGHRLAGRMDAEWRAAILGGSLLPRVAHLAPLLVIRRVGVAVYAGSPHVAGFVAGFAHLYLIVILVAIACTLLDAAHMLAHKAHWAAHFPVSGIVQGVKLVLFLVAAILILSVFLGQTPAYLLSGLGALTAVLMLIFKDAILGLTAGIMLTSNRMISIGDWIEMPSAGADGDVVDVTLTTVKVQNWDKTIVSIPAYSLISGSFKNWRGMSESGGRRIKRAINIDTQTVRFADEAMLARWRRIGLIRPYLDAKLREIAESNRGAGEDVSVLGNGRRLTNLGTFRAYCEAYLRAHRGIHKGMTLMVRQLAPTETGLPLELYTFTNNTDWTAYEGIQSDIMDHLLSIIGEFDLAVYQRPSGADNRAFLAALSGKRA
ncbi:MAG: mechanosensitive ion channel family protein [Opitutaceae bacterium]|jgi:miniconductance mechanosensitive channel|nr:mechanosensitive ion channel family protein [Opitutaceae bacterium]